jgi:prolyl-tRNA synthetase
MEEIALKVANLVGDRFKETPSGCVIDSHIFMMRGGYIKYVANGIYSQYPPLRRVLRKIENILREEMDAVDGQEVLFPVALPGSLWEQSGRLQSVGAELLRFTDRGGNDMVLGMTHEEAAVQLVREYGQSYAKYPFMIYQIQTKFRDEARPRGGLIRVREFTMKDAYSFHTSQQDLDVYYARCHKAYERIFARAGMPGVVSVASDSGMMGGSVSYEFIYPSPSDEDTIALCGNCDFRANVEAAENIVQPLPGVPEKELTLAETPGISTIDDLCRFLKVEATQICKAVAYQKVSDGEYVLLFLRGDIEANEAKLARVIGDDLIPAALDAESGLAAGYIGPIGLPGDLPNGLTVLFDHSLAGGCNLACGANRDGFHYTGFNLARDLGEVKYGDYGKIQEGGVCPHCGEGAITLTRGIEVGHIFQLGTKYSEPMQMQYTGPDGEAHYPIMGCYGIGVGRLAASVIEAHHDEHGPVWPMAIAPWQVHICCVRADEPEVHACADALYEQLRQSGVEVLYDDREVSAGILFSDADLFGVPIRVIVSPRNLSGGIVELAARDKSWKETAEIASACKAVQEKIKFLSEQ